MSYLLAALCAFNLVTFARAMPKFAAPDGWPASMRWLSLCGMVCGVAGLTTTLVAPATLLRGVAGAALALASHGLFRWAIAVALRHRFAVAFADARPAELTTDGPYRWLSHPLYVSYAATWWAMAAGSSHWAPTAGALVMSAFYVSAAVSENRVLRGLRSPAGLPAQCVGGSDAR